MSANVDRQNSEFKYQRDRALRLESEIQRLRTALWAIKRTTSDETARAVATGALEFGE